MSNICKYALEDTRVYAVASCNEKTVTISLKNVSRAELMEGPSPEIIRLIREEIDPGQAFIKVPKDK